MSRSPYFLRAPEAGNCKLATSGEREGHDSPANKCSPQDSPRRRRGWDISRDTLAKIEDQRRWVADFEVAFLAEVLKVSVPDLFISRGRSGEALGFHRSA